MLAPDSRAVLLEQLAPPPGQRFGGAVATTFTLDLTATLIPALAFSSYSLGDGEPDPVALLESIRASGELVDVFCQGGCIVVPHQAPDLLAFLEPMVHEVERPAGGLFHPKTWFVKYLDDEGHSSYRLLVLTRNLTHDNSWDIAVRLDAQTHATQPLPENAPLGDFLTSLADRSIRPLSQQRSQRIMHLAQEARRAVWEHPETVEEISFHFLDGARGDRPDLSGRRHLVVSPFVNDAGLGLLDGRDEVTVLSRPQELERLSPTTLAGIDTYVLDTMAGVDDSEGAGLLGQLHAKMYIIEADGQVRPRLLIGSANATDAAFQSNVEFLVEFAGPRKHLGIDAFIGQDAPFATLLEKYEAVGGAVADPSEEEQWALENCLRTIAEIPHSLQVVASDDEVKHALHLTSMHGYRLPEGWVASGELLTGPGRRQRVSEAGARVDVTFSKVATADITRFVVIRVRTHSGMEAGTVLVADLTGEPHDRLDRILARQIDTPEKFLRFLYLLLSLGDPYLLALLERTSDDWNSGFDGPLGDGPGVLELTLRALAERPAALEDLDRLVRRLQATDEGRDVLPEGFDRLWSAVSEARRSLKRDRR